MIKKSSLLSAALLLSATTFSHAYSVDNPVFYGDTSVINSNVRIYVSNIPSGNCDGRDLYISLGDSSGDALYQTYLTSINGGDSISRIYYSWDSDAEKCEIYGIVF